MACSGASGRSYGLYQRSFTGEIACFIPASTGRPASIQAAVPPSKTQTGSRNPAALISPAARCANIPSEEASITRSVWGRRETSDNKRDRMAHQAPGMWACLNCRLVAKSTITTGSPASRIVFNSGTETLSDSVKAGKKDRCGPFIKRSCPIPPPSTKTSVHPI